MSDEAVAMMALTVLAVVLLVTGLYTAAGVTIALMLCIVLG